MMIQFFLGFYGVVSLFTTLSTIEITKLKAKSSLESFVVVFGSIVTGLVWPITLPLLFL